MTALFEHLDATGTSCRKNELGKRLHAPCLCFACPRLVFNYQLDQKVWCATTHTSIFSLMAFPETVNLNSTRVCWLIWSAACGQFHAAVSHAVWLSKQASRGTCSVASWGMQFRTQGGSGNDVLLVILVLVAAASMVISGIVSCPQGTPLRASCPLCCILQNMSKVELHVIPHFPGCACHDQAPGLH